MRRDDQVRHPIHRVLHDIASALVELVQSHKTGITNEAILLPLRPELRVFRYLRIRQLPPIN